MKFNRKRNGEFKRKSVLLPSMTLGFIIFLAVGLGFNHTKIMASIDKYSNQVAVTEVKINCTLSTNLYSETCLKKITDEVATSLSELVAQEKVVNAELKILDDRRGRFNQAVFNLETVAN